ncbi:hypothetical protein ACHQM5_012759 [Ranunculus cassubicifolius]
MKTKTMLMLTATLPILAIIARFLTIASDIPGARDILHTAEVITLAGAVGPESLAFDPNGEGPYTGVADGRILKWQGHSLGWTEFAYTAPQRKDCIRPFAPEIEHICGRPLGLRFHPKTGDLYIADAYLGLHKVGSKGGLSTKLISSFENEPFVLTNDLDIDEEKNIIYFTVTSAVYQRRQFVHAILSMDTTGRLMKYDIKTGEVKVLSTGIPFANGVALSKDRSFLLVAATTTSKIQRYWLQGPNAGSWDVFAKLQGHPDNIRRNSKGEFWVALHSKDSIASKFAVSNPWLVKLSDEGEIIDVLEDSEGKSLKYLSEVEERDGELWIGSVIMPFIGRLKLN